MRTILAKDVSDAVAAMCMEANRKLPKDVLAAFEAGYAEEEGAAKEIFRQLLENAKLSEETGLPLCQDCGLAIFFVEMGSEVHVEGATPRQAVEDGMIRGYKDGYLRKSACDPFSRKNTGDNAPAIVHLDIVPGDKMKITMMAKGGGSENMSRVTMLSPAQGWKGVKEFVVKRVAEAGPNPCPPTIIGVGIGGTFEYAPILAKKALCRAIGERSPDPEIAKLEAELLEAINKLNIGPMGLGGKYTTLDVKINVAPCHLASLPLAVNVQCHSSRHKEVEL